MLTRIIYIFGFNEIKKGYGLIVPRLEANIFFIVFSR